MEARRKGTAKKVNPFHQANLDAEFQLLPHHERIALQVVERICPVPREMGQKGAAGSQKEKGAVPRYAPAGAIRDYNRSIGAHKRNQPEIVFVNEGK